MADLQKIVDDLSTLTVMEAYGTLAGAQSNLPSWPSFSKRNGAFRLLLLWP